MVVPEEKDKNENRNNGRRAWDKNKFAIPEYT